MYSVGLTAFPNRAGLQDERAYVGAPCHRKSDSRKHIVGSLSLHRRHINPSQGDWVSWGRGGESESHKTLLFAWYLLREATTPVVASRTRPFGYGVTTKQQEQVHLLSRCGPRRRHGWVGLALWDMDQIVCLEYYLDGRETGHRKELYGVRSTWRRMDEWGLKAVELDQTTPRYPSLFSECLFFRDRHVWCWKLDRISICCRWGWKSEADFCQRASLQGERIGMKA